MLLWTEFTSLIDLWRCVDKLEGDLHWAMMRLCWWSSRCKEGCSPNVVSAISSAASIGDAQLNLRYPHLISSDRLIYRVVICGGAQLKQLSDCVWNPYDLPIWKQKKQIRVLHWNRQFGNQEKLPANTQFSHMLTRFDFVWRNRLRALYHFL